MSTTISTTTTNPHIEALEMILDEAPTPVEWLVIAHNDPQMLRSLSSALSGQSAAVLEVSEDTWDLSGQELSETIQWALERCEINNLVVVGHSQTGGVGSQASFVAAQTELETEFESGHNRLIAGVQRANARNRAAQERFARQVQQMLQIPIVDDRCSKGELTVCALFYRAESGLFLTYNASADTFHALVS